MNQRPTAIPASEAEIEAAIVAKGKTAPRITPADIEAEIASEHYFTAADAVSFTDDGFKLEKDQEQALGLLTFCVLVLKNGFTVTGESACASPENFDPQIGRDIARRNARDKIWALEGYRLKSWLHDQAEMSEIGQPYEDDIRVGLTDGDDD